MHPRLVRPRFLLGLFVALLLASPAVAAVYYVAQQDPAAADGNPGTEAQPLKTISAATAKVQPGDTVYVKAGVYREMVIYPGEDWKDPDRRITLAAFPGHHPVIKGSDVVTAPWERAPGDKPLYSCARDVYTQMVFVDEVPLRQIGLQGSPERAEKSGGFRYQKQWDGKGVADMAPGTFFYDEPNKRLYVWLGDGGDPAGHVIEASVRHTGFRLKGTWTLSGFDVRHIMDARWPNEQAVGVVGNRCLVEGCRITHNEFIGLIVSGEDCVIRGNEIAHNGLMGFCSNYGYRMLFEGNECHDNAWRGDVVCLTAGHKWVMWRDSKFLRNWWHDELASALWLDISDANILIAENRFENCPTGVYWEISRWAVIANNTFRNCGRGVWSYGADALIAHNVFDGCGEGVLVSGYPRHCNCNQSVREPSKECLMAVRNNLVVNNIFIDCPGSNVGATEDTGFGAGNYSDYNVFVWTLPMFHRTGNHINFQYGWNSLYARLPEWQIVRHCDTHSLIADPGLFKAVQADPRWAVLGPQDLVADAGLTDRAHGDYRLKPDSPLHGRGIGLPLVLNSGYQPGPGAEIVTRAWAPTLLADAPDPKAARSVYGGEKGHYRLQPLPALHRLVDLDAQPPGTPGFNTQWLETGQYPTFDAVRKPDTAGPADWVVFPENRLADPKFDQPFTKAGAAGKGPWFATDEVHMSAGIACANLFPAQQTDAVAFQKIGPIAPDCEYILFGQLFAGSAHDRFAAVGSLLLAAGEAREPVGQPATLQAEPLKEQTWKTVIARYHSGKAGEDPHVGQDLYVVFASRVKGPADLKVESPVAFVRADNLTLLTGSPPE